jgi:hypothetical protein
MLTKTIDGIDTSYAYNDNGQLETRGSISYAYDANGNLISNGTSTYHNTGLSLNLQDKDSFLG